MIATNSIQNTAPQEAVISVKGVSKSFAGVKVLDGIDLEVYKGENLVVLGKSGSGKSVLIKIIAGLFRFSFFKIFLVSTSVVFTAPKMLNAFPGYFKFNNWIKFR